MPSLVSIPSFSLLLCMLVASMSQSVTCAELCNELMSYNRRISYAGCKEGAQLLDAVGPTAAFVHQKNIIVCQTRSREEDAIVNVFDFVGIQNIGEMGGAFSHRGRFLTISSRGPLKNNQNFYIFQNVGMYRELLQATREAFLVMALPIVLTNIIRSYCIKSCDDEIRGLQDQQYFLSDIETLDLEQAEISKFEESERTPLSGVEFYNFQWGDPGEIVCYAKKLCDPTVVFNVATKTTELRAIGDIGKQICTTSQNGRFVLYKMRSKVFMLERKRATRTFLWSDPVSRDACSIDHSGNLIAYRTAQKTTIELAIHAVHTKDSVVTITFKQYSSSDLIGVCLLSTNSCLLKMKAGAFKVDKNVSYVPPQSALDVVHNSPMDPILYASLHTGYTMKQAIKLIEKRLSEVRIHHPSYDVWTLQGDSLPVVLQRVMMKHEAEKRIRSFV